MYAIEQFEQAKPLQDTKQTLFPCLIFFKTPERVPKRSHTEIEQNSLWNCYLWSVKHEFGFTSTPEGKNTVTEKYVINIQLLSNVTQEAANDKILTSLQHNVLL